MMKSMALKPDTWIPWLGATAVAAIAGTFVLLTFAYGEFETKEHSKERAQVLQEQLKTMDEKLDRILIYQTRTR